MPASAAEALRPDQLSRPCDPARFRFATTAEIPESAPILGQDRAMSAIEFGMGIRRHGYNVFALGPSGAGKHAIVLRALEQRAAAEPTPTDWCYVHDFATAHRPRAVSLPPGKGVKLRDDMARLVEDLRTAITAALETEEYRARLQEIEEELSERRDKALAELRERAAGQDVALIRTPLGFALAPMRQDHVLDADAFGSLPEEERQRIRGTIEALEEDLDKVLHQMPKWQRETRDKIAELKRAVTTGAVGSLIEELKSEYEGQRGVEEYLSSVQGDVIENAEDFRRPKNGEEPGLVDLLMARAGAGRAPLGRYQINVLVDHGRAPGAPVIYEDKPDFPNLIGRIEHIAQMGTLVTDFTLIKPGALHRANGGYLVLDARRVLLEPFAWDGLKRALRAREVRVDSLGQALGLVSTVALEPEPIPLDLKVVLIGDPLLYYLLYDLDPDFRDLFKVPADFEASMDRSEAGLALYAALVGTVVRKERLRPFTAAGVARVIDHAARMAGDTEKVSVGLEGLSDLLREADHWAALAGNDAVDRADVQRAIDARIQRAAGLRDRLQKEIERGTIMIATDGDATGQVNGLSIVELGGFAFARPSRITARVRLGAGAVIDIEREVRLGGPLHSKGVLILSGFLAGRYVPDQPLSLSATLVFEQSYGFVEGDSASSAELYALLSALADVPIKQALAVTGSVNQRGEIQSVGALNEKIEGFFDLCKARSLTGAQGVLIPAANKRHLMLRDDVIQAVKDGMFHIFAVETVDQGIEILTGVPAGTRDKTGQFPEGTINHRVERRLTELASQARAFRSGLAEPGRK
jgi:predicted ATP-dependent protease